MKLLVLAQTPPPVHGQSLMVRTLVTGLPERGISVHHVNLSLSRHAADIGRWGWRKVGIALVAALRAVAVGRRHGCDTLYYVPAPAKRGALYRDLAVMLICRPFFRKLVLHWHAVGLGEWTVRGAAGIERWGAHLLLGRASLAIVLAPELVSDAAHFAPRRFAVIPNGVPDPGEWAGPSPRRAADRREVLFVGQCSRAKGLFAVVDATVLASARIAAGIRLTVAGEFADAAEEREFQARLESLPPDLVRHVGFADDAKKRALFQATDVFCFPTIYPHEGQPLVLIEALAHDVRIVTTRLRAIPSMVPPEHVWFVEPHNVAQVADALVAACHAPSPGGVLRAHYLAHFTSDRHLDALKAALLSTET